MPATRSRYSWPASSYTKQPCPRTNVTASRRPVCMRYLSASSGVLTAARPRLLRTRPYLPTHYPPPTRFGGSLCGPQSTAAQACPQPCSLTPSPRHHRANAGLGEELQQQRVRRAPIDDVRERHPLQRAQARLELRDHPAGHLAGFDAMPRVLSRQHRDHMAVDAKHTGDIGEKDHLGRAKGQCDLSGDSVGVDVVGMTVVTKADRSDHRDVTARKQRRDRLAIDLGHAADETHLRTERLGDDAWAVLAAHADRLAAKPVDGAHDVGIHFSGEHHLYDFHRFVVGDAQPVLELCLQAEALAHRRDLWSPTMYEHRLHADVTEQHDVEQRLVPRLLERVATDLDHDDLAVESLDVRQRLDEDLRSLVDCQCHVVYSAFIRTYSSDRSQPQASAWPPARPNDATISISGCSNARLTAARSTLTPAPRSKTTRPPMLRCSLSSASSAPPMMAASNASASGVPLRIGAFPAAPLASTRNVSLVELSPSTVTWLKLRSATGFASVASNPGSTAASVVM